MPRPSRREARRQVIPAIVVRKLDYLMNGERSKRLDWGDIGLVPNEGDIFEFRGREYRLIRIEEETTYSPLEP